MPTKSDKPREDLIDLAIEYEMIRSTSEFNQKSEKAQRKILRDDQKGGGDEIGGGRKAPSLSIRSFRFRALAQANPRPLAVLLDEDHAGQFKGGADGGDCSLP